MNWQTILNGFAPGGNQGVQGRQADIEAKKAETQRLQQEAEDRHRDATFKMHDLLMQQDWKPVVNNLVREDYSDLPSFSAPAPSGSDIPQDAQMPSSVPAIPGGFILRPADKSRVHSFPDHTGEIVSYEQPSFADMMRRRRQIDAVDAEKAGNVAEQAEGGRQRGLQAARQGPSAIALPEGSGVGAGQKFLPEELPGVVQGITAATELPSKLQQAQRVTASQSLGSVTTKGAYQVLYDRAPEFLKSELDSPYEFDPIRSPMRARMLTMSPSEQQKTSTLMNVKPEEWDSKIRDSGISEGQAAIVKGYVRRGEFDKADAMLEKATLQPKDEATLAAAVAKSKRPGATPDQIEQGQIADATLKRMTADKVAARPVNNFTAPQGVPEIVPIEKVPEAIRGTVQRIINGDQKLPSLGRNNATNQAITYWIGKVDPTYTESRADLKKSFTSGKDADNVKSLNTVMNHLGSLADNADKLDNTTFRKYNTFGNWLSRETGTDKTAPFRVDRQGVASELGTLLKGGVASIEEVKQWENQIDSADSPGTLKSSIREIAHIISGRVDALENKRAELPAAGRSKPLLSDKSKAVMDRLSGAGGTPAGAPIVQHSASTGAYRYSLDGGKTWQAGQPPR